MIETVLGRHGFIQKTEEGGAEYVAVARQTVRDHLITAGWFTEGQLSTALHDGAEYAKPTRARYSRKQCLYLIEKSEEDRLQPWDRMAAMSPRIIVLLCTALQLLCTNGIICFALCSFSPLGEAAKQKQKQAGVALQDARRHPPNRMFMRSNPDATAHGYSATSERGHTDGRDGSVVLSVVTTGIFLMAEKQTSIRRRLHIPTYASWGVMPDWLLLLLLGLLGLLGYLEAQLFRKIDTEELLGLFSPWVLWHLSVERDLLLAFILVEVVLYGNLGADRANYVQRHSSRVSKETLPRRLKRHGHPHICHSHASMGRSETGITADNGLVCRSPMNTRTSRNRMLPMTPVMAVEAGRQLGRCAAVSAVKRSAEESSWRLLHAVAVGCLSGTESTIGALAWLRVTQVLPIVRRQKPYSVKRPLYSALRREST